MGLLEYEKSGDFFNKKNIFWAIKNDKIICKSQSQLRAKFCSCCIAKKRVNTTVMLTDCMLREFYIFEYVDADLLAYSEERSAFK